MLGRVEALWKNILTQFKFHVALESKQSLKEKTCLMVFILCFLSLFLLYLFVCLSLSLSH